MPRKYSIPYSFLLWLTFRSEAQYKKRLRIWRMEKNISKRKMAAIIQVADRRKAQGKDTIFAWHGLVLDEDKIERARKRFGNPPEASSSTGMLFLLFVATGLIRASF